MSRGGQGSGEEVPGGWQPSEETLKQWGPDVDLKKEGIIDFTSDDLMPVDREILRLIASGRLTPSMIEKYERGI